LTSNSNTSIAAEFKMLVLMLVTGNIVFKLKRTIIFAYNSHSISILRKKICERRKNNLLTAGCN